MVGFAGWEMPVQYEGVRPEHVAVRTGAGLFDVSHMGEIETRGPRAEEFLRRVLSNDIRKAGPGGAQYALLCREDGGVLDDLFTYWLESDRDGERFLTVVNASNAKSDFGWFARQAEAWDGVEVSDRSADFAMLALQGPEAIGLIEPLLEGDVPGSVSPRAWGRSGGRNAALPHRLHGRGRGRAPACAGRCGGGLEGARRSRREAGGARRARHAAARGLLPALRERPLGRADAYRGGAEVGLRAGQRLHRLRAPARPGRARPGREARALRFHGARDSEARLQGVGRR
jgi:hypothetical protein